MPPLIGMDKHTGLLFNICMCIIILFCATTLNHAFAAESACQFPAIFNFGASNSDTGGFAAAFYQLKPPYGCTFFGKPAGRFCDGRLIIDFTAESLGLPFLSPYLNSLASNFSHGANFATSGSTIMLPSSIFPNGSTSPFYLTLQFGQFAHFKDAAASIRKQGGVFASLMPSEEYYEKALYTFDVGQNDLTASLLFQNMTVEEFSSKIPNIVKDFCDIIKSIYGLGGRSFWVYNTRPLGCFPSTLTTFQSAKKDSAGCAKPINEVVQQFNLGLKKELAELRTQYPLATIVYVDLYSAVYSLYENPQKYGFQEPLKACCGQGGEYNFAGATYCGQKANVNGKSVEVGACKDPSTRINWDGSHLTEAANKIVFDRIVTGNLSDPPIPLNMACRRHSND